MLDSSPPYNDSLGSRTLPAIVSGIAWPVLPLPTKSGAVTPSHFSSGAVSRALGNIFLMFEATALAVVQEKTEGDVLFVFFPRALVALSL